MNKIFLKKYKNRFFLCFFVFVIISAMSLVFFHPTRILVTGCSSSGKTVFVTKLLNNVDKMFNVKFDKIIWALGDINAKPSGLDPNLKINFVEGLPLSFENPTMKPMLIVLDDLMNEIGRSEAVANVFTKGSHHRNQTIILLNQSLFPKGQNSRLISLNAEHIVAMKNPRTQDQFAIFCRQHSPQNWRELNSIYKTATEQPFSYLVVNLTQTASELCRYRQNIFEEDYGTIFCQIKPDLMINDIPVRYEEFEETPAFSTYFTKRQL